MDLSEWDAGTVGAKNADNVKALEEGDSTDLWASGEHVLIGEGHPQEYYDLVSSFGHGSITKTKKGSTFDKGTLTVSGVSGSEIASHISDFSQKKVVFA